MLTITQGHVCSDVRLRINCGQIRQTTDVREAVQAARSVTTVPRNVSQHARQTQCPMPILTHFSASGPAPTEHTLQTQSPEYAPQTVPLIHPLTPTTSQTAAQPSAPFHTTPTTPLTYAYYIVHPPLTIMPILTRRLVSRIVQVDPPGSVLPILGHVLV